jgi:formamidopyrimidine-DNA glycosylase
MIALCQNCNTPVVDALWINVKTVYCNECKDNES